MSLSDNPPFYRRIRMVILTGSTVVWRAIGVVARSRFAGRLRARVVRVGCRDRSVEIVILRLIRGYLCAKLSSDCGRVGLTSECLRWNIPLDGVAGQYWCSGQRIFADRRIISQGAIEDDEK